MKQFFLPVIATLMVGVVACKNDSNSVPDPGPVSADTLRGEIKTDRTLEAGKKYWIDGAVFVKNNATLTIKEGVVLKAIKKGKTAATADISSFLIITRGAKINAVGTKDNPIVFTSAEPKGSRAHGDWGGVMLLGKTKVNSIYDGKTGRQMEGFPTTQGQAYGDDIVGGGDLADDNSGILKYVRIEFAGVPLSDTKNSELNSITLIGVGKSTTIEYVQSSFGGDDAFEWFGGNVNARYLVAYRCLDDDFDTDNGYSGNVQFGLSIKDKDISDWALPGESNGFESDNDAEGSAKEPFTAATFSNITFIGPWAFNGGANIDATKGAAFRWGAYLRRNTRLGIFNTVFAGFPTGIYINEQATGNAANTNALEIKNSFVGVTPKQKIEQTGITGVDIKAWFMTPAFGNDTSINNVDDFKFAKMTGDLKDADARPVAGSPLIGKASFTSSNRIKDAYFKVVDYVGAFKVGDDWTQGWTNFDPNNADY